MANFRLDMPMSAMTAQAGTIAPILDLHPRCALPERILILDSKSALLVIKTALNALRLLPVPLHQHALQDTIELYTREKHILSAYSVHQATNVQLMTSLQSLVPLDLMP